MELTALLYDAGDLTLYYTHRELLEYVSFITNTITANTSPLEYSTTTLDNDNYYDYIGVYCNAGIELIASLLAVLSINRAVYVPLTGSTISMIHELYICIVLVQTELYDSFIHELDYSRFERITFSNDYNDIMMCHLTYSNRTNKLLKIDSNIISEDSTNNKLSLHDVYTFSLKDNFKSDILPIILSDNYVLSNHIAFTLQSSGTTGKPKSISVPHSCIIPNIIDFCNIFQLTQDDVTFLSAPPTFDPSIVQIFTALCSGSVLLIVSSAIMKSPKLCLKSLFKRHLITVLQCTPSFFTRFSTNLIRKEILSENSSLRVLAFGGEQFPDSATLSKWKSDLNKTHFFNLYGITEVSCWATCYHISHEDIIVKEYEFPYKDVEDIYSLEHKFDCNYLQKVTHNMTPLGGALTNTHVEVRDDDNNVLQCGVGQIWVGGTNRVCVVDGEGRQEMRNTGDIGVILPNSRLYCIGRSDKQIKKLGHRINLYMIEKLISEIKGVEKCIVDSNYNEIIANFRIIAYCVVDLNIYNDVISLRKIISQNIQTALRPDIVKIAPYIPLTQHGKLDLASLIDLSMETTENLNAAIHTFIMEECSVLNIDITFSGDRSLLELGCTSFDIVGIMNRLVDLIERYNMNNAYKLSIDRLYDLLTAEKINNLSRVVNDDVIYCRDIAKLSSTSHSTNNNSTALNIKKRKMDNNILDNTIVVTNDLNDSKIRTNYFILRRGSILDYLHRKYYFTDIKAHLYSNVAKNEKDAKFSVKWKFDTKKCIDASPLVVCNNNDVIVYIGSHSGLFSAIDVSSGVCVWQVKLDDRIESSAIVSLCNSYIIVCTYSGVMWVLMRSSGEKYWTYDSGTEPIKSSPCIDSVSGFVWVGTHSQSILCIDICNRCCVHNISTNSGSCYSSPTIDTVYRQLYIGTHGGDVISICTIKGSIKWRRNLNRAIFSSPLIINLPAFNTNSSVIIVAATDGSIYALTHDNELMWNFSTSGPIFSSPCEVYSEEQASVIVTSYDKCLYCIAVYDGKLLWSIKLHDPIYGIPFISAWPTHYPADSNLCCGVGVFVTIKGNVLLINNSTHNIICQYEFAGEVYSSPILYRNNVIVGCRDNFLYCLQFFDILDI